MNKFIGIGNLTADPTSGKTQSDIAYCRFSVAIKRRGKDNGVDFFNIETWRGLAENCQRYLAKGKKVCVTGEVQLNEYTSTTHGVVKNLKVIADEVEFLSPQGTPDAQDQNAPKLEQVDNSDLPF